MLQDNTRASLSTANRALARAVSKLDSAAAEAALADGADPNLVLSDGRTVIVACATAADWLERPLQMLLDQGVDPDTRDTEGHSIARLALATGAVKAVRYILDAGADSDNVDANGNTLVHVAAAQGNQELVRWCLAHARPRTAAGVGSRNAAGQTALHLAAPFPGAAWLLLADGADPGALDAAELSAADLATDPILKAFMGTRCQARARRAAELAAPAHASEEPDPGTLLGVLISRVRALSAREAVRAAQRAGTHADHCATPSLPRAQGDKQQAP
jgi:hypothetical protein